MWVKKGLLLDINKYLNNNISSHATIPFAHHLCGDNFRIFFSSRNSSGKCLPYFIDVEIKDGSIHIISDISKPIIPLGSPGTFDDSGIMPSSLVKHDNKILMYYIGWNIQVSVSYRLSIGLAISEDGGENFYKYSQGPILDRSVNEPFFNTAPFVIKDDDKFKMWYSSCTGWVKSDLSKDKMEPIYNVKYCESYDGIIWNQNGTVCIDYNPELEAIGRPCVFRENNKYEIYFSHRKVLDYRENNNNSYKIGKSKSIDGVNIDDYNYNIIPLSEHGWDSTMVEYCHVFEHNEVKYMLYNGDGFGLHGFGYAIEIK